MIAHKFMSVSVVGLLLGGAAFNSAAGIQSFDFSYVTSDAIGAFGTLVADDAGLVAGTWLITSLTGVRNGVAMTLLSPGAFEGNDNLMFAPAFKPDFAGWSFSTTDGNFNLYNSGGAFQRVRECRGACIAGSEFSVRTFSVIAVPETPTVLLTLTGLLGVALGSRSRH